MGRGRVNFLGVRGVKLLTVYILLGGFVSLGGRGVNPLSLNVTLVNV